MGGRAGPLSAAGIQGRDLLRSRAGRILVVLTAVLGVLGAVAVVLGSPPEAQTMATTSGTAQLLMSVTVPFLGVVSVQNARRTGDRVALRAALLVAAVVAASAAAFGVVTCAVVTAAVDSEAVGGRWRSVGAVVLASLLVQLVAQATGTGFGMLVRRAGVACLLTIVVPLGLWALLGATDGLRPAQAWLTPFPSAQRLLGGQMAPVDWARWLVVALLWGLGLNLAGLRRASR